MATKSNKTLWYAVTIAFMLSLGGFFGYKYFLAGESSNPTDSYSMSILKIQQLKTSNTKFNYEILESDEFVQLNRNGNVPVKSSEDPGRTDPFSF